MANNPSLHRCLKTSDLILLGIGAIIGAGVFVLTGIAAATKAGPAVTISYFIAGTACIFTALSYAELAASISGCGSAYSYAYTSFGPFIGWLIGWNLILEYVLTTSTVAVGWSGYANNFLQAINIHLPHYLTHSPLEGGVMNLPAMLIVAALCAILCRGVRESSTLNTIIVFIKLFTIALFIVVAFKHIEIKNWENYFAFGWSGTMQGAALVFFAYIGFDAVSTTAEETIDPQRSLPIGIVVSVAVCTLVYIIVAAILTGIVPYTTLNVDSPVANALLTLGHRFAASLVAVGAIAGLTSVMLVMYFGVTRILYAVSRDKLLPTFFSKVDSRSKTPVNVILLTGLIIILTAGFIPLQQLAELVNIGTLTAFTFVCGGVIILRRKRPDLPRPFKMPFSPYIPFCGIILCGYLMLSLPAMTWWRFVVWILIGIAIYRFYGMKRTLIKNQN